MDVYGSHGSIIYIATTTFFLTRSWTLNCKPCNLKKTWDFSAVVSASVQPWSILKKTALVHIRKKHTIEWNTPELASGHQCDPNFMTRGSQRLLNDIVWLIFVADSSTFSVWNQHDCSWHVLFSLSLVNLPCVPAWLPILVIFQIWKIIPSTHFCKKTSMTKRQLII